jgi:hypothetical protein
VIPVTASPLKITNSSSDALPINRGWSVLFMNRMRNTHMLTDVGRLSLSVRSLVDAEGNVV